MGIIGIVLFISIILIKTTKYWQINTQDVVNYLDKNFKSLEESTALLLLPTVELNTLQLLQIEKVNAAFRSINIGNPLSNKVYKAFLLFL